MCIWLKAGLEAGCGGDSKHPVAENVTAHIADSDCGERSSFWVVHAHFPEVTLYRLPGAASR